VKRIKKKDKNYYSITVRFLFNSDNFEEKFAKNNAIFMPIYYFFFLIKYLLIKLLKSEGMKKFIKFICIKNMTCQIFIEDCKISAS
jgi:hypothetical protein